MSVQRERLHKNPVALLAVLSNNRLLSDCLGGLRFGRGVGGPRKGKEKDGKTRNGQQTENTYRDRRSNCSVFLLGQGNHLQVWVLLI